MLSKEDRLFRQHIINMSCLGKTLFQAHEQALLETYTFPVLEKLADDGLVKFTSRHCQVTAAGYYFIRNICSAFDLHLQRSLKTAGKPLFSMAV